MRVHWKTSMLALVVVLSAHWFMVGQAAAPQSAPPPPPSPQDGGPGARGTGPRRSVEGLTELRRLSQQLNLTEEQKEKLRPIVTEEGDKMSALRLDEHIPLDQKRAKMVEIREAYRPKIAAILTLEQQEKWKKMQEAAQQMREQRMKNLDSTPPAPAPPPPAPQP
jgi:periplasmic protein CpxP/Spy